MCHCMMSTTLSQTWPQARSASDPLRAQVHRQSSYMPLQLSHPGLAGWKPHIRHNNSLRPQCMPTCTRLPRAYLARLGSFYGVLPHTAPQRPTVTQPCMTACDNTPLLQTSTCLLRHVSGPNGHATLPGMHVARAAPCVASHTTPRPTFGRTRTLLPTPHARTRFPPQSSCPHANSQHLSPPNHPD